MRDIARHLNTSLLNQVHPLHLLLDIAQRYFTLVLMKIRSIVNTAQFFFYLAPYHLIQPYFNSDSWIRELVLVHTPIPHHLGIISLQVCHHLNTELLMKQWFPPASRWIPKASWQQHHHERGVWALRVDSWQNSAHWTSQSLPEWRNRWRSERRLWDLGRRAKRQGKKKASAIWESFEKSLSEQTLRTNKHEITS